MKRPNVLVILTDDQGWGDLSVHGNTNLKTPNVDSLARDGAIFDRFYVCPVCAPTRAEFLTGRYHLRTGVHGVSTGAERLNLDEVTNDCQLIVTCTPSKTPLINSVNKGTHVTAMGSDTVQKQELHSNILYKADLVISDSRSQSADRGEIHHALKDNLDMNSVVELGEVISNKSNGRIFDKQITIADLTGVAVQDIQIAKAVLNHV